MTIAKKPAKKSAKETKAAKFITDAGKNGRASQDRLDLVPVLVNFDRGLLTRVDAMAKEMGLNRTAFVVSASAEKLRALERTV
ncbi:MAG TPA: hypothetical protein VGH83_05600 [Candidatus Acidoferrum sp.]|jgi:hypothetical protein